MTLYAQEIARLTHRALLAEARVAALEEKLSEVEKTPSKKA